MTVQEAIAQAYKNGYEKGKRNAGHWIPVTERLPDVGETVLVSAGGRVYLNFRIVRGGDWCYGTDCDVTHWMPMPKPAKEYDTTEPKCPKCGKPYSFEHGTYYCHLCRIMIDPDTLELLRRDFNG